LLNIIERKNHLPQELDIFPQVVLVGKIMLVATLCIWILNDMVNMCSFVAISGFSKSLELLFTRKVGAQLLINLNWRASPCDALKSPV
jgi:hypothetical protein